MTPKLWRLYAMIWIPFLTVMILAIQADALVHGHFSISVAAGSLFNLLPAALLLALVWPFTGYLERSTPLRIIAVHFVTAIAFTVCWQMIVHLTLVLVH